MTSPRKKSPHAAFRMPLVQTMVSRKSSITNAFVNAVIPVITPSSDEVEQALEILGMQTSDVRCVYCGDLATEWDHLRPLVTKARPTGFISEIANLVPSCGKCNQSKGNKPWREWMLSAAGRSPTARGIGDTAARIARLEAYEAWRAPTRLDIEKIIGKRAWDNYWQLWEQVNAELARCQEVAESLRQQIAQSLPGPAAKAVNDASVLGSTS